MRNEEEAKWGEGLLQALASAKRETREGEVSVSEQRKSREWRRKNRKKKKKKKKKKGELDTFIIC